MIKGPVYSIITPFNRKGGIDYKGLCRYIDNVYDKGGRNFYVMPYCSRYSLLTFEEIRILNQDIVTYIKSKYFNCIVIVSNPILGSQKQTIDLGNDMAKCGADIYAVILQEKIYSNDQIYLFYLNVITKVKGINLGIHAQKFFCGKTGQLIDFPLSVLTTLCRFSNIKMIKEDHKDDEYTRKIVSAVKDKVSIIISGKGKQQWLSFADQGCQAWLAGSACAKPEIAVSFWNAYEDNNIDKCLKIIKEIENKFDIIKKNYGYHLGIKSCIELEGIFKRFERAPLIPLNNKQHKEVKKIWNNINWDIL